MLNDLSSGLTCSVVKQSAGWSVERIAGPPGNREILKATKTAIAGFTKNNQDFKTHELKLKEGDIFYIFTDGYADTFGGVNDKKLMTKNFKDLLVKIRDKNMQEQSLFLDNFIEQWKSGREQCDDILVIGVKV